MQSVKTKKMMSLLIIALLIVSGSLSIASTNQDDTLNPGTSELNLVLPYRHVRN